MTREVTVTFRRKHFDPDSGELVLEEEILGAPEEVEQTAIRLGFVRPRTRPEEPDAAAEASVEEDGPAVGAGDVQPLWMKAAEFVESRGGPGYAFTLDQLFTHIGETRRLSASGPNKNLWYRRYKVAVKAMQHLGTTLGGKWERDANPNADGDYVYRFKPTTQETRT